MDSIVNTIISHSGTEKDLEVLANKKLKDINKSLSKNRGGIDGALESLDYNRHTLGCAVLLAFQAEQDNLNQDKYVMKCRDFLLEADAAQIQYIRGKFEKVAAKFGEVLFERQPMVAIAPLRDAIMKTQAGNPHILTAIHPMFVLCCIKAGCFHAALPVIDNSIYEIGSYADNPLTPKDNLLYHYYASVCYIGFKNHQRAVECLLAVLTAPTSQLSAIQVAAFKKYILVSLLLHEKVPDLPRFTSPPVSRSVEKLCQPYKDLADAYQEGFEATNQACNLHGEKFAQDENFGLMKQVITSMTKKSIKKLTDTYLTLSLENIAQRVGIQDPKRAESLLVQMIEDGEISAEIDEKKGMVSFLDDTEEYATQDMVEKLDGKIQEVLLFWRKVSDVDKKVTLHPTYISKTVKGDKGVYDGTDDQDLMMAQAASLEMDHGFVGI